ncbi:MAG: DUF2851 family protein [Bacteroidia bacterium]
MIPEDFLHYVWRTRSFDHRDLRTNKNQPVFIEKPGIWNHDQGPDFSDARVKIDDVVFHGHVEIHIQSEDWYRHRHHEDEKYNNTILHIAHTTNGKPVRRADGTVIPEIVLADRIPPSLLLQYNRLQLSQDEFPCSKLIHQVKPIVIRSWIDRMAVERIEQKAAVIQKRMDEANLDWEQLLWEELAAMMGGPVNKEVFREMAQRMPHRILRNYVDEPFQLEALLFGICRLLTGGKSFDIYFQDLKKEWEYLAAKHKIELPPPLNIRFLRMRPAAFPTIRISQIAQLLMQFPRFTDLLSLEAFDQFLEINITTSAYWENHYRFFEDKKRSVKKLGKSQKEILMANVILPIAWLYHRAHGRNHLDQLVENGLTRLSPENNRLTRPFMKTGISNEHAFDSQGLIQLKKRYCDEKRCLECGIGGAILGNG